MYKTDYFLDTNFIITKEEKCDSRYEKLFLLYKNYYITEYFAKEVEEKLKDKRFRKINKSKFKTVSFDDLYKIAPICPVYHNFIATMYNPANFSDPEFPLQFLFSKIIKKRKLTDDERNLHMWMMSDIVSKLKLGTDNDGEIKSEWSKVIDETHLRSIKKRKDGLKGKNKNFPNDIRNLATIFVHSIIFKRNITFITSDSDAIAFFFDWSSSIIQEIAFNTKCLEELGKNDREGIKRLLQNKKEALFFNAPELSKFTHGTLQKFYNNDKKYFSPRLSIKYWDKNRKKYFEVGVNIDNAARSYLMYLHGSLNCPTAKNDIMGCFIKYISKIIQEQLPLL